jgi:putative membrane protein
MSRTWWLLLAATLVLSTPALAQSAPAPSDPQIVQIALTAGRIDMASARQALAVSTNPAVRAFAGRMLRDHGGGEREVLVMARKAALTPAPSPTSAALVQLADAKRAQYATLAGRSFDKGYAQSEIAFDAAVAAALAQSLIPAARNPGLKRLLQSGLAQFRAHQALAERLAAELK